jgi:hypothetical protein
MEKKLTTEDFKKIAEEAKHLNIRPLEVKIPESIKKFDKIEIAKERSRKILGMDFYILKNKK